MSNPINDLQRVEELFAFLQGTPPDGWRVEPASMPILTAGQAWTVIWYLANLYWQVPDHIERCGVCGTLFDTESEGACLDYGDAPYQFCDECTGSMEYERKVAAQAAGGDDGNRG